MRGLRGGADDYLTKPFGNAEFVARVQVLLRRRQAAEPAPAEVYDDGSVRVNFGTHEVVVDGVPVELTATEYRLLAALIRHRGQVLSPVKLLDLAWSDPFGVGPERVKYTRHAAAPQAQPERRRRPVHRGGPRLRLPVPDRHPVLISPGRRQPSRTAEATRSTF